MIYVYEHYRIHQSCCYFRWKASAVAWLLFRALARPPIRDPKPDSPAAKVIVAVRLRTTTIDPRLATRATRASQSRARRTISRL